MYKLEECIEKFKKIGYLLNKHVETESYEYFELKKIIDVKFKTDKNKEEIKQMSQYIKIVSDYSDSTPLGISYSKVDSDNDPVQINQEEANAIYMLHCYLEII